MKKKMLILIGVLCLTASSITACGSGDNSKPTVEDTKADKTDVTKGDTSESNKDNDTQSKSEEVSFEALEKHEETDLELFEYRGYQEGIEICGYLGDDPIVVVPEKIEGKDVISVVSLNNDNTIEAIKIADTVKKIGDNCFGRSQNLKYVIIGDNVEKIGDSCFLNCQSLKKVELNEGLLSIGHAAFGWTDIDELEIPSSVQEIGEVAFDLDQKVIVHAGSYAEQYAIEYSQTEVAFPYEVK